MCPLHTLRARRNVFKANQGSRVGAGATSASVNTDVDQVVAHTEREQTAKAAIVAADQERTARENGERAARFEEPDQVAKEKLRQEKQAHDSGQGCQGQPGKEQQLRRLKLLEDKKRAHARTKMRRHLAQQAKERQEKEQFAKQTQTIAVQKEHVPLARPQQEARKRTAIKAVVFDFDLCLLKDHWWGRHQNAPLATINPRPHHFGHSNIGALFTKILRIDGVALAVASFGRHDVIKKAINSVLPTGLTGQVFVTTPRDFAGFEDGWAMGDEYKNMQLRLICTTFGLAAKDIVFFDDSEDNVVEARAMGCAAHMVKPFTDEHVVHIADHLGRSGSSLLSCA